MAVGRGHAAQGADLRPGAGSCGAIRTSCPAGWRSGWSSRWRSPSSPSLLILDEPTTALDATVEAEVLDLVAGAAPGVRHLGAVHQPQPGRDRQDVRPGRGAVRGRAGRGGPAREVFDDPRHPYTVGLLRCIPRRGQRKDADRLDTIPGFLPTPGDRMTGCVFAPRCALAVDECRTEPSRRSSRLAICIGRRGASSTSRPRTCRGATAGFGRPARAAAGPARSWWSSRGCPRRSAAGPGAGRGGPVDPARARRSGWWASRAAARPRWPGCCSG